MMCCRTIAGSLFGDASVADGFARRRAAPAAETAIINTKRSVRGREILMAPPPKALFDAGRRETRSTPADARDAATRSVLHHLLERINDNRFGWRELYQEFHSQPARLHHERNRLASDPIDKPSKYP